MLHSMAALMATVLHGRRRWMQLVMAGQWLLCWRPARMTIILLHEGLQGIVVQLMCTHSSAGSAGRGAHQAAATALVQAHPPGSYIHGSTSTAEWCSVQAGAVSNGEVHLYVREVLCSRTAVVLVSCAKLVAFSWSSLVLE
jgi:hypothetical protein